MPIQVETRDCAALTDADLDEMASMGGAFDIGVLSKAKEDWVLCTTARVDEKLHGCTFSTLERIGGTPCVLVGLASVKRGSKRDTVLKAVMHDQLRRAVLTGPFFSATQNATFTLDLSKFGAHVTITAPPTG